MHLCVCVCVYASARMHTHMNVHTHTDTHSVCTHARTHVPTHIITPRNNHTDLSLPHSLTLSRPLPHSTSGSRARRGSQTTNTDRAACALEGLCANTVAPAVRSNSCSSALDGLGAVNCVCAYVCEKETERARARARESEGRGRVHT